MYVPKALRQKPNIGATSGRKVILNTNFCRVLPNTVVVFMPIPEILQQLTIAIAFVMA